MSTGIRAALDRATRSADVTPQDGGRSPRSDDYSRTTKYVQEDGFRAGRWRDLGGRFTTPPSPGDEVISQAEALARRASLAASSAAAAADAADAAASAAATRDGEKKKDATKNDAFIQHPMVGDPGLKKTKSKKIQDVDKSWEKINQADADAAAQAASAPAVQPAGQTLVNQDADADKKDNSTGVVPPVPPAPPASQQGTDAQTDKDIPPGSGAMGSDVEKSSISAESRDTLQTETSFSVTNSAFTPKSAFTFADSSSNISPESLPNAVQMNNDSDDESVGDISSDSRSKKLSSKISSLKSRLAQAIEDKQHAELCTESLQCEIERMRTENAIEVSALNEAVGDMRLEAHELELQLNEALAQREEEIDQRLAIEKVDREETLREAIAETERLRAALAEEQEKQITTACVRGKLEDAGKDLAASRQEKKNLEEQLDKVTNQKNQVGAELSILRTQKRDLADRVEELENVRSQDDERYRALLKDYDALAEKKVAAQMKSNQLEESLRDKEKIVLDLHSVNAELKKDIARARAPKYVPTRSQSVDATHLPRKAASSAGSSASERSSSCSSLGSKRSGVTAKVSEPKIGAKKDGHDKEKDKYRELRALGREIGRELNKGSKEMSRRLADIETSNSKRQTIPQLANGHRDKLSQLKLDSAASVSNEEKIVDFRRLIARNLAARLGEQGERISAALDQAIDDYTKRYKNTFDQTERSEIQLTMKLKSQKDKDVWASLSGEILGFVPTPAVEWLEDQQKAHGTRPCLSQALAYLIRVYGMPNVDSLKITRDKFLALKWVSEPGRILEWLEAYKRRLDKLMEMKVLTKEDDFSPIVNSFRKAIKQSIIEAGGEEKASRELVFVVEDQTHIDETRYCIRKTHQMFEDLYKKWHERFTVWYAEHAHRRRILHPGENVSIGLDGPATKKEGDKGQGLDRLCDHCGKPKRDHPNKSFEKCNEAAAKKKKEEEKKKIDAIEGTPPKDVDNTEKGAAKGAPKGGAAKGTKNGSPGSGSKGGTPQRKKWEDLSAEEKQKISEIQKARPCPIMSIKGNCHVGASCRYSHDKELCSQAMKTECKYGEHCIKRKQLLKGREYGGWPSCVYLHGGTKCTSGWNEPSKKIDEVCLECGEEALDKGLEVAIDELYEEEEEDPTPYSEEVAAWGTFDPASDIHTSQPLPEGKEIGHANVKCATGSRQMAIKAFSIPTSDTPVNGIECHKNIYSAPLGLKSGEIQGYSHFVEKPKELVLGFPAVYVRREGEVVGIPMGTKKMVPQIPVDLNQAYEKRREECVVDIDNVVGDSGDPAAEEPDVRGTDAAGAGDCAVRASSDGRCDSSVSEDAPSGSVGPHVPPVIPKESAIDHTAYPLDGDCKHCGGKDHWVDSCPHREAGEENIKEGLTAFCHLGERLQTHVRRYLKAVKIYAEPVQFWASSAQALDPPHIEGGADVMVCDIKVNNNGDIRFGFISDASKGVSDVPGTFTLRIFFKRPKMLEEELEYARVREAKVNFAVDSIDMGFADVDVDATERDARREFWRQFAVRRVTESRTTSSIGESLGERELRTDSVDELGWFADARHCGSSAQYFPKKMKHVTKAEKNCASSCSILSAGHSSASSRGHPAGQPAGQPAEEGEPLSSRAGPPSSRVDEGEAHGGCVVDANEAEAEQPSAGPAVVEESDADEGLDERIADGEDTSELPAAEADSLIGLREREFQEALKETCPGMKGAKARRAYSEDLKRRLCEALGLDPEDSDLMRELEFDAEINFKRRPRASHLKEEDQEQLAPGVVYCDDIPIRPEGSRGESALGFYANSHGEEGGLAISHKSSAGMVAAAKAYEAECSRIEELRHDEGKAIVGKKMVEWEGERNIIRSPLPSYSQHMNLAESRWSQLKPHISRVMNRKKGKVPPCEWPYVARHCMKVRRLLCGAVRRRYGAEAERSLLKHMSQFGTKLVAKDESLRSETFDPHGIIGSFLWPVRAGIAFAEVEIDGQGRERLGPVRTTRNYQLYPGEFHLPRDRGGESFGEAAASPARGGTERPPVGGATGEGDKPAKRGRGRPKKRIASIDHVVSNTALEGLQPKLIEQALTEAQEEKYAEARTALDDGVQTSKLRFSVEATVTKSGIQTKVIDEAKKKPTYDASKVRRVLQGDRRVDVIESHSKKKVLSGDEWYESGKSFREVFGAAMEKERKEVFDATGSFEWHKGRPLSEWRELVRRGEISEPALLRYVTIFCTKNVDNYSRRKKDESLEEFLERIKELKAKARTVCHKEVWLLSGRECDGRHPGEILISRTPTPSDQKIALLSGCAKNKEIIQTDELGMYPWTPNRGVWCIGLPPIEYWPPEEAAKWTSRGIALESIAVPCPMSNYGKKRAGFDACNAAHEAKLALGWQSLIQGVYAREPVGVDVREPNDPRGDSWGPDIICNYVDDDMSSVTNVETITELEKKRNVPRTWTNVREEPSKLLGVGVWIGTWSEEECGVADPIPGETISVVVLNQKGLLESWVTAWREAGNPVVADAETPLPPGATIEVNRELPLGRYADQARHHVGIIRYAVVWTRAWDLSNAAAVLSAYFAHWDQRVDRFLERTVGYVEKTLNMVEVHIVSSREAKEGLTLQAESDASHAGHSDMRGQSFGHVSFKGPITSIQAYAGGKVEPGVVMSSCDQETKAAVRVTTKAALALDMWEVCMCPPKQQLQPVPASISTTHDVGEYDGKLKDEGLYLDATATIARIKRGSYGALARHAKMRVKWLTEYWSSEGRHVDHRPGATLLADIGTKSVPVARFVELLKLSPLVDEKLGPNIEQKSDKNQEKSKKK